MELLEGYQYWLKFNGSWLLENPQELDTEKYLIVRGEFEYGSEVKDTKKEKYLINVSPLRIEFVAGDKVLKGKVKKRNSQRVRGAIWHHFQTLDLPEEQFDDYYEEITNQLIAHLPEVLNFLGK